MKVWTGDPRGWGPRPPTGTVLTIGVFDGVHRGHRAVLGALAERARAAGNLGKAVVTFDVHPRSVVVPARAPKMLTTLARRLEILEEIGIDYVGVLPFDRIRHLPPEEFIRRVVVDGFGARTVMVGRGFRYGAGRTGDVASLREAGEMLGFDVDARRLLKSAQGPISSSSIRRYIADGDVATANRLLGRLHELAARVTGSAGEGRRSGLQVADVEADSSMAIPGQGLYAAWTVTRDGTFPAVCDIAARRPRSGSTGSTGSIRSHSLDPADELPPGEVRIRFAGRLGDQRQVGGRDGGLGRIEPGAAKAARRLLDRTETRMHDS